MAARQRTTQAQPCAPAPRFQGRERFGHQARPYRIARRLTGARLVARAVRPAGAAADRVRWSARSGVRSGPPARPMVRAVSAEQTGPRAAVAATMKETAVAGGQMAPTGTPPS